MLLFPIFSLHMNERTNKHTVANEQEPTNGLKILRKKNIPVDLNSDLTNLSSSGVTQRLKLILEKLESSQHQEQQSQQQQQELQVSREVLRKNIQYAVDLLQQGESSNRFVTILHSVIVAII